MYALFVTFLAIPFLYLIQTINGVSVDQYFVNIGALASAVVIVTEFFKKINFIAIAPSWVKQILSWAVAIAGSFIGSYFNLGVFANLTTTYIIIYGLAVGLIANGIFDFALVQALLNKFKKKNAA